MPAVMDRPEIELSDETKQRIEEVAVAAFHNLLLGVVANFVNSLDLNVIQVATLQQAAVTEIQKKIVTP